MSKKLAFGFVVALVIIVFSTTSYSTMQDIDCGRFQSTFEVRFEHAKQAFPNARSEDVSEYLNAECELFSIAERAITSVNIHVLLAMQERYVESRNRLEDTRDDGRYPFEVPSRELLLKWQHSMRQAISAGFRFISEPVLKCNEYLLCEKEYLISGDGFSGRMSKYMRTDSSYPKMKFDTFTLETVCGPIELGDTIVTAGCIWPDVIMEIEGEMIEFHYTGLIYTPF